MRWRELLFAHWIVDPSVARSLIPTGLQLGLFEVPCYAGSVPFLMERVTPRLVPPLPGLTAFPELSLRTYVTVGAKAGVWLFCLDAGQKLAVRVARQGSVQHTKPWAQSNWSAARTFDAWFTDRYCLYAADGLEMIYRGEIDYQPWRLQIGCDDDSYEYTGRLTGNCTEHPPTAGPAFYKIAAFTARNLTRIQPPD